MNAIFIFGFMLPVAAIRVWKPAVGVDWKTAFHVCSANESRLPKVRMRNNGLEVEDHIPFNLSSTFWLGAVYEPLNIDTLNVENLGFPDVCCGVFLALSDKCKDSCIPCHEFHAYKCMVGQTSDFEGVGPWIKITRICSPTAMTRGQKNDKYWTYDIRRIHLDPTTPGQTKSACTYYCAGAVLRGDCSISSGIDAICVSDKVDTSYSSTTSTASTKVSTGARNSSLVYTAIRIWKPVTGVDWKTALLICSANESRLPRVRVTNNSLELVDDIASNISNTFWLGAVYETIQIDPFNVSDNDLGFPRVCCNVFPAFTDTCMDSCISCDENHAFKCKISQQNNWEGVGPWILAMRLCSPSAWKRGDRDGTYWNHDIRRLSLNLTTSGEEKDTCTYFCAGSVLLRECSDSSGVDTVCVTDKVDNLYPGNTSTVSAHVSTDVGNSSLEYTDGTLSTHFSTDTIMATKDSTSIRTQMTEHSNNKTSTSTLHLRSTSIAFPNSTLKSQNDNTTSSTSKRVLEENWFLYWGITGAVSILLTVSMIVIIILVMKLRQSRRQVVHARKNDRISMQQLDDLASYQNLDDRNRDSKNIYDTLAP